MKKTVSLILAIVLSMTVFVSNITGITMIVRAEEYSSDEDQADEGTDPAADEPGDNADGNDTADETDWLKQLDIMAQQNAEQEAARQAAYEQAAADADEAAAAADAAAEEARRLAEEEEQRAREAEEAQKAEEEKKKQEEDQKYSLVAYIGPTQVTTIDFGSFPVGAQRDYRPLQIINTGNNDVDLICAKVNDADAAFSMNLHGDKMHLEPGGATVFNVSMRSDLGVGNYEAKLLFGDSNRDPNYTKALAIKLKGQVAQNQPVVTGVSISPTKATLAVGNDYQFFAVVKGTGEVSQEVRWSISGNRSTGTRIASDGLFTLAADETSGSITVMAASVADGSFTGTSVVTPQRNSYNVSVSADPKAGGAVTGGGAVSQGGTVTLSAVPNKNYFFAGWVKDGKVVSTSTNYTISDIQSNISVKAKFGQRYVTVTAVPNNVNAGTVVGGGNITYGQGTILSAKAYSGYVFTGWKEGNTVVSKDASIRLDNLTYDRAFMAVFEQTTHTLTLAASPAEGGKVSGGGTFELGKGTTIKAEAASGYKFQGWQINGQTVSREATVKIDKIEQDFTCTAVFAKESVASYEISSGVATTGGSITPSGKNLVAKGTNMTYAIAPKSGFAILAVAVDGVQVGAVNSYTFTNVQGPHTISAAFVQTDAGRTANESSGKPVQEKKVEVLPKTESNTATAETVVDVVEAVSGEGGDDYVEEMINIEEIPVPADGQLGIEEEPQFEAYSEVTQMLGLSMNEVSDMVASGNVMPILDAAFYSGTLGASVQNAYEPKKMTSVDYSTLSREELMQLSDDVINPSLPDLDVVVEKMLTTDDIMTLAKGGQLGIAVSLSKQDKADSVTERIMKNAVGQKPLQYFDLTMLKTADGYTERVTELPTTMEVVIEIPDEIYKSGKTYSVLRVHDGELKVLPDLDDDPKTITFRTDRFSSYAIAREVASSRGLVIWLIAGAAIALGIAITCFLILIAHQNYLRRSRQKVRSTR